MICSPNAFPEPATPPRGIPEEMWGRLQRAASRLLILDYDGTLAPFRAVRMDAEPYPGVRELLTGIIQSGGKVVLVSGRQAHEVAQLLAVTPTPEIWGCHGWERLLPEGVLEKRPLNPLQQETLDHSAAILIKHCLQEHIESKHGSLALHWRGVLESKRAEIMRIGRATLTPDHGSEFELREFDGGLELRALGCDKGSSVRSILVEAPPGSIPAYLGDDQTDEDAFAEVKRAGGLALLVRPEARPSQADGWIVPPADLLMFLQRWNTLTDKDLKSRTE